MVCTKQASKQANSNESRSRNLNVFLTSVVSDKVASFIDRPTDLLRLCTTLLPSCLSSFLPFKSSASQWAGTVLQASQASTSMQSKLKEVSTYFNPRLSDVDRNKAEVFSGKLWKGK